MKITLIVIGAIALSIIIYFFVLGYISTTKDSPGLTDGQLSQCSTKPNCVCSESENDEAHSIEPLHVKSINTSTIAQAEATLKEMGAEIISKTDHYIAATFTSGVFRFVDDFEVRIDGANNVVHIRSASRVGRSDLGVNKKRAEAFKVNFLVAQNK